MKTVTFLKSWVESKIKRNEDGAISGDYLVWTVVGVLAAIALVIWITHNN